MKRSLLVLLALSVFGILLACDAATTLLSNPTPVVIVVTATPPGGAPPGPPPAQATSAPPVAAQPTSPPAKSTVPPTLPPPTINVPVPKPGTGNIAGRVLWNGKGAGGLEVKMCDEFQFVGGCKGKEFTTRTDQNGVYILTDVTPGEYALAVHALDKDSWLYITAGLLTARKYTVTTDKTLNVGDQSIFRTDIKIISPTKDSKLADPKPVATWEAYPEAAYYSIIFGAEKGEYVYFNQRVDKTSIAPENPLLTCRYSVKLEAFNAQGVKIAETDGYRFFYVTGQPVSCYIQNMSPADNAKVSGTSLKLSWDAHPLANSYSILMWKDAPGDPKILDFLKISGTTYTLNEPLQPGRYVWSVRGLDQFGKEVAGTAIPYSFTVQ